MLEGIFFDLEAVSPVVISFPLGILMVVNLDIVGHVIVLGRTTLSVPFSIHQFCALDSPPRLMTSTDRLPYQATAGFD